MIRLNIPITENYTFAAGKAFRAQKRNVLWSIGVVFLILLAIIFLFVMLFASPSPWFSLLCLLVLVGVPIISILNERKTVIRSLRARSDYNTISSLSIDGTGLVFVEAHSQTTNEWSSYTHAREIRAGVLLYNSPESFILLRDSDVVEGTPQALRELVKSKINDFKKGKG